MNKLRVERGPCRFIAEKDQSGKSLIQVKLFHGTVSLLNNTSLSFSVLGGISLEQAKKVAEILNENVLDICVSMSADTANGANR